MTSEDFDRHFERYLNGSLSSESSAELCECLRDPRWQKRWRELSDLDGMLAGEFGIERPNEEEAHAERVSQRSARRPVHLRRKPVRGAFSPFWPAAAAVLLLTLIGFYQFRAPQPAPAIPALASLEEVFGKVTVLGRASNEAASVALKLNERDGLLAEKGARATLRYADGTRVSISSTEGVSRLWLHGPREDSAPHGKLLSLEAGILEANVAPQLTGMPMWIHTPIAAVKIVGTHFTLSAAPTLARLEVRDGRVQMERLTDGKSVDVAGGFYAVAAPDTELVALPIPPAAVATVPVPAPAKTAVRPLFNGKDLSGWQIARGQWKVINGVMTGSAPNGGRARIASEQSYDNIEMTCKMRVTGTRLAELQVGGYRYFFQFNWSTPGVWKDVKLRMQGKKYSATLDGEEQQLQRGEDDFEVPVGVIAFYTTEKGTLEIKDAQVTELKK